MVRGEFELSNYRAFQTIAGVDEVGRGCLAGPVYAACAILDYERVLKLEEKERNLLTDSKLLSPIQRANACEVIEKVSIKWAVSSSSPRIIERSGILPATFRAMRKSIKKCETEIDLLLVDGKVKLAGYTGEQRTVVKGDLNCYSIAAASILAKEARDKYMSAQAKKFPEYGFDKHVGYGTRHHMAMLNEHGPCTLHRRNFAPVTKLVPGFDLQQGELF